MDEWVENQRDGATDIRKDGADKWMMVKWQMDEENVGGWMEAAALYMRGCWWRRGWPVRWMDGHWCIKGEWRGELTDKWSNGHRYWWRMKRVRITRCWHSSIRIRETGPRGKTEGERREVESTRVMLQMRGGEQCLKKMQCLKRNTATISRRFYWMTWSCEAARLHLAEDGGSYCKVVSDQS